MDFKEIYQKYASEGLELKDILKVWKEERLSPERIRQQLSTDIKVRVSSGEAKELYKIARTDDFNFKTAEVGVSWELGEREGAAGLRGDIYNTNYENACACKMDPDYAPNCNWQNGFSVINYTDDVIGVEPIVVHGNKATVNILGKTLRV